MDYQQAIQYIEELALINQTRPEMPSLRRMQAFLSYYDSPQNSFTSLHIGGTNGKGSTVAMLDSILRQGPLKIGRFTGPHLLRFNERLHVNGQPINDYEFTCLVSTLKEKSQQFANLNPELGLLSWFEFLTAMAFFYFAQTNVDIAVIEVGLGGRFDATNTLEKMYATGITNIALDHQKILGSKIEDIAFEKAGIIKPNIPIITSADRAALTVLSKRAAQLKAKLIQCNEDNLLQTQSYLEITNTLAQIKREIYRRGIYQYQNALMSLTMLKEGALLSADTAYSANAQAANAITIEDAIKGLMNYYWPGRFQIIESEQIILDGAHNPAGIKALRESLDYLFPNQHFHFIFACYADKDGLAMLSNLLRAKDRLYLTKPASKRSFFSFSELANYAKTLNITVSMNDTIGESLAQAKNNRRTNEFIVTTGSFSLIKAAMKNMGWQTVEDGLC